MCGRNIILLWQRKISAQHSGLSDFCVVGDDFGVKGEQNAFA